VELGVVRSPAVLLTAGTPEHPALSGTASQANEADSQG
jgi:hypothetical protein